MTRDVEVAGLTPAGGLVIAAQLRGFWYSGGLGVWRAAPGLASVFLKIV